MNILVTGGSGFIGHELVLQALKGGHNTSFTYNAHARPVPGASALPMSLDAPDRIANSLSSVKPDIVIHAAALTAVDECETDQKKAHTQNALATGALAHYAKENGALFVYLSTTFVFPKREHRIEEEEPTNPMNYYGQSKMDGELAVIEADGEYQIWRTDQPYGFADANQKQNAVSRTLRLLKEGKEVSAVSDWWNTPTYLPDLVDVGFKLMEQKAQGIFHLVGSSYVNRVEWGRATAQAFGYDPEMIVGKKSEELGLPAKRPNVNADNGKAQRATGRRLHTVAEALELMRLDARADEFVCKKN